MASERLGEELEGARVGLLRVHKALLDHEKVRYERARGRISGAGHFLELVINDPWFAWLHAISELAVEIDEYESEDEQPAEQGEALLKKARGLLVPDENGDAFQKEYYRALQESPAVVAVHGEWRRNVVNAGKKGC